MVPRMRTVSCADAGKTVQIKARLAAASMRWSVWDMSFSKGLKRGLKRGLNCRLNYLLPGRRRSRQGAPDKCRQRRFLRNPDAARIFPTEMDSRLCYRTAASDLLEPCRF